MSIYCGKGTLFIDNIAYSVDSLTMEPTVKVLEPAGPVTAAEMREIYGKFTLTYFNGQTPGAIRRGRGPRRRRLALNWRTWR